MKLFDTTLTTLKQALDVRLARQGVLAANVANADTPGYKPLDLDFEAAMADATQAIDVDRHLFEVEGTAPGFDGNGVDLDQAMVGLGENAMQYGATTRAVSKKLAILRYVASDGNAG